MEIVRRQGSELLLPMALMRLTASSTHPLWRSSTNASQRSRRALLTSCLPHVYMHSCMDALSQKGRKHAKAGRKAGGPTRICNRELPFLECGQHQVWRQTSCKAPRTRHQQPNIGPFLCPRGTCPARKPAPGQALRPLFESGAPGQNADLAAVQEEQ